jgi:hypothetical protein
LLAESRTSRALYAAAGLALGLSVIIRAFYLYPALACASVGILVLARKRARRPDAVFFGSAFAIPLLLQVIATHHFTGAWAFIDPAGTAYGEDLHFRTITYGYDTVLPARGVRYDAPACFHASEGMLDAVAKHAWSEVGCLVAYREWFYFGSYTPWGRVYLSDPGERRQSLLFLLVNASVVVGASVWALKHAARAPMVLAILVFLGAIWGEGAAIIPETRFLVVFYIAAWSFAVAAAMQWRSAARE